MSDQHSSDETHERHVAPLGPAKLMTPQATAIAGFAFAVFSMMGQGSWTMALTALLWGTSYDVGTAPHVMAVWGVGCLIMSGLAVWLANGTLRLAWHTWEAHLARAAVLVAAAGAVLAVISIIGGLVHGR